MGIIVAYSNTDKIFIYKFDQISSKLNLLNRNNFETFSYIIEINILNSFLVGKAIFSINCIVK